jgi:hypothetical protein
VFLRVLLEFSEQSQRGVSLSCLRINPSEISCSGVAAVDQVNRAGTIGRFFARQK